jgi:hypothetical protein
MPFDENDENDEKDEIIIQSGGELSTGAKWAIGLGVGVPLGIIIGVLLYLYNMDHIKELQEACVEIIRKELKMQMRLCLTYDLKISKMKGNMGGWTKPKHHNHDFSKIFILNKIEKNYFFDKLNGEWNKGVSFKTIFEDNIIQKMLQNNKIKINKEAIVKYIIFDIFFSSINDVIIDEILNDFKKNGLKDAKPKKNQKKDKALKEA